jgi:chromosome partitioning protein
VPLQPSMFDIAPTSEFVADLLTHKRSDQVKVAVVGNRVKENTKAAEHLQAFLATLSVPLLGMLRDTQNYTHLAAHGLSLWDVPESRVEKDLGQWVQITAWLDQG